MVLAKIKDHDMGYARLFWSLCKCHCVGNILSCCGKGFANGIFGLKIGEFSGYQNYFLRDCDNDTLSALFINLLL